MGVITLTLDLDNNVPSGTTISMIYGDQAVLISKDQSGTVSQDTGDCGTPSLDIEVQIKVQSFTAPITKLTITDDNGMEVDNIIFPADGKAPPATVISLNFSLFGSYYHIKFNSHDYGPWDIYTIIKANVAMLVLRKNGSVYTNEDVGYNGQVSIYYDTHTRLSISTDIVSYDSRLLFNIDSKFKIVGNGGASIEPVFKVKSTTTNSTLSSVLAVSVNGKDKIITTNSNGDIIENNELKVNIVNIIYLAYLLPRGSYTIQYADPGSQAAAEYEKAAEDQAKARAAFDATISDVGKILGLVKEGTEIVKNVVDTAGKIAEFAAV